MEDRLVAPPLLLRGVRLLPVGAAAVPDGPVDVRLAGGRVDAVGPGLRPQPGDEVRDADGRWAGPGLWDAHVHLGQWARSRSRLDVGGTAGPDEVVARVRDALAAAPSAGVLLGYGHRSATWDRPATVAALDAVSGDVPVVLCSGDAHNGWLNSAALRLLGLPPVTGPLVEDAWFAVLARLEELPGAPDPLQAYRDAVREASARGVVGVVDMEWERGTQLWPERVAAGVDGLRVQPATYPADLDALLETGLRDGDPLPGGRGLVTTGPLKVIFDGSLNTATACCRDPYGVPPGHGVLNLEPAALTALLRRADRGGLRVAVHAIGDAAVGLALDAVQAAGARGSVEHAQLVSREDLPRFAALGVTASVQPAHLLDDRDVTVHLWPDRQERCFPLRSLSDAGAVLALGSDAPVAALDPWLAMAAAVHRSADDREAWVPQEALTPAQALAASTGGQGALRVGAPADVVLLDTDPLAPAPDTATAAARLREVQVAATVVGGRVVHARL